MISDRGLSLINAYRDAAGFVTGSAREAQQRHDAANGGSAAHNDPEKKKSEGESQTPRVPL
jgi:hypothetical protein